MREKDRFITSNMASYSVFHSLAKLRFAFLCLVILASFGCNNAFFEKGTQIKIVNRELPPEFKLQGNRSVLRLFFYGPYTAINVEETQAKLNDPPIWEISPPPNTDASDLPMVRYGNLPQQFTQNTPVTGVPPQLVEGKCYIIIAPTNGPGGSLSFCIKGGKAIVVNNP